MYFECKDTKYILYHKILSCKKGGARVNPFMRAPWLCYLYSVMNKRMIKPIVGFMM